MNLKKLVQDEDIDWDEYKDYVDLLKESTDAYDDNVAGLNKVALANKRMEKGVKKLSSDWKKYDKIMSDSNSTLSDISTISPEVEEAV
jgi:hypothetical protein